MSFKSIKEILELPKSLYFNASTIGDTGHRNSWYAGQPRLYERSDKNPNLRNSPLTFDISNNYIQASLDIEGTIQCAQSAWSLKTEIDETLRGVFVKKQVVHGDQWSFNISLESAIDTFERKDVKMELLENLFPVSSFYKGDLKCSVVTFAPTASKVSGALPVVIYMLNIQNTGDSTYTGNVKLPGHFINNVEPSFAMAENGQSGIYIFDRVLPVDGSISFKLLPDQDMSIAVALIIGKTEESIKAAYSLLKVNSVFKWFSETLEERKENMGTINIEDQYYSDALVRMEELCRNSIMLLPDGSCTGGTLGSNVNLDPEGDWNTNVWMKDNFYAALPMAMINPNLCEKAAIFFLKYGVVDKPWGRGTERYPNADAVMHSLGNALSGIVLAVTCYVMNDNKDYFHKNKEFFKMAKDLLDRISVTRKHKDIWLFPSMYISDGDSRGDFHTGSNVIVWYCYNGMARICREVYEDLEQADLWQDMADKIKKDIKTYCKGSGLFGEQYFEGAYIDGSFVACNDGEESDVALMSFYGMCEADDPSIIRYQKLGLSEYNPLYSVNADGIAWFDAGYCCDSTFPGFTSALAGAENEEELLKALDRIRKLTDLDGSVWWWSNKTGCKAPWDVSRYAMKCCWAAGVYVSKFMSDIIGIKVDRPAREIRFRPFSPWGSFKWDSCKMGSSKFDLEYGRDGQFIKGIVTNKNDEVFNAYIELMLPEGAVPVSYKINDENYSMDLIRYKTRYRRPSYIAVMKLQPDCSLNFEVGFKK